jgi:protein TonB
MIRHCSMVPAAISKRRRAAHDRAAVPCIDENPPNAAGLFPQSGSTLMSVALAYRKGEQNNLLLAAVAVSVAAHALILALRFVGPESIRFKHDDSTLDIILVNKSGTKPVKAKAVAQVDMNGGGENEKGRVTSFLPASAQPSDGEVIKDPSSAVARLEAEQKKLLTQLQQSLASVAPETQQAPQPVTETDLADLNALRQQIARQEAQLDKQIQDYNSRPQRGYIGASARRASYAMYYRAWADKIERIGTLNYPEEARGRLYGTLILHVTLNPDGTIYNDEVIVTTSSGYPILDRAAKRIVRMAAPYGRFPDEMRREYDVYEIVAKFAFTREDAFEAEAGRR